MKHCLCSSGNGHMFCALGFYKVEANHQEINESIEKEWNVLHPPRNQ